MKKHMFTYRLAMIILIVFGLSNIATAGGTPTDSTLTTSFDKVLTPWLMKGQQKTVQLDWSVEGQDTLYSYVNNCGAVVTVKTGNVKWLMNANTTTRQVYHDKWMDLRTWYGVIKGYGYEDKRQIDSLARVVVTTIHGKLDSRPLITSIYTNSPNAKRLSQLESDVAQIKTQLGTRDSLMATKAELNAIMDVAQESFQTVGSFIQAVDAHLSASRGHAWTKTKREHEITIQQPEPEGKTTAEAMPKPRRF